MRVIYICQVLDPSCLVFPDSFSGLAKDLLGGLLKVGEWSLGCVAAWSFFDDDEFVNRDMHCHASLQHDPSLRLGVRGRGVAEIKEHGWFGGLDWSYVYGKVRLTTGVRMVQEWGPAA